jgi:hypothetical protein
MTVRWGVRHLSGLGAAVLAPYGLQLFCVHISFYNGFSPLIIRPKLADPTKYELIGESYIDGLMYGEAFKLKETGEDSIIALI